ncbi:hypothetical protein [Clostridium tertium]|uniref:Uncharacterized protein n=1 Tax=Clostridium tertium TaxID=1559 RepID=A0A6N3DK25_9CLOT
MSAFVLNREFALQLPNSYVEIDRDEMEYVDGGATRYYNLTGIFHAIVGVATGAGAVYSAVKTLYTVTALAAKTALKACVGGILGYLSLVYYASQIALACTYLNRYGTYALESFGIGSYDIAAYVVR